MITQEYAIIVAAGNVVDGQKKGVLPSKTTVGVENLTRRWS